METRTLVPATTTTTTTTTATAANHPCPIRYARLALLETLPPSPVKDSTTAVSEADAAAAATVTTIHTTGIHVLNLVIFPPADTTLPVWGADFVTLPGGSSSSSSNNNTNNSKHLILLDAQPMQNNRHYESQWQDWYKQHNVANTFPWGGDMPEAVQQFVSKTALWTRFVHLKSKTDSQTGERVDDEYIADPLSRIQGPLVHALQDHLDIYLDLLDDFYANSHSDTRTPDNSSKQEGVNYQADYIAYRLANDPARPMLKALYGEEWTEQVLQKVLFPQ